MLFPPAVPSSAYILTVLELLRKDVRFFLAACLAGFALRLIFFLHFPAVVDDSRLYADIAENWLQHGVYGITDSGHVVPTLSRLPGYPAFLAAVFAIFGWSNFRAVLLIQVLIDLATCFLISDIARRIFSNRAAKAAFMLSVVCPFLANYASAALTETLEIFFTTLAFSFALRGIAQPQHAPESRGASSYVFWLALGLSIGCCMLLRPDGGILFGAVALYLFFRLINFLKANRSTGLKLTSRASSILIAGLVLTLATFAPLIPWTIRNFHAFHRFEPLAPRYANDSDELVMTGFNRWTKTWMAESTSVQEIYWKVPGDPIELNRLPNRAFDSPEQRLETDQIFADYNQDHDVTPEIDARFAALAAARIRAAPLRYYVWLPALRIADMWLRPRTELLASDPRWWEFNDDSVWLTVSIVFGVVNLAYVVAAIFGLFRARTIWGIGLFTTFLVLRSVFLGTLENPEPRYTLECYPVIIILAAALFSGRSETGRLS